MASPTNPKIEELRGRLKADPKSRLFFPLAEELRKIDQRSEAEQVLRAGLANHPTYLSAWVSLGRVLHESTKDADAVEALNRALQIDPGNVVAARLLGDAYLALGDKVEAIKKYKLVRALLPADEELDVRIEQLERDLAAPADGSPWAEPPAAPPSEPSADVLPFAPPTAPASEEAPMTAAESQPAAESPTPGEVVPFASPPTPPPEPLSETSPFGRVAPIESRPEPWSEQVFPEEAADAPSAEETSGDEEPMRAAHAESPFEDPTAAVGYTAAAFEVEQPPGMQLVRPPLVAEVPAPLGDEGLPPPELAAPAAAPGAEAADVFAPAETPPAAVDDVTNTLTMADLYARQGLADEAREIYETLLQRDPANRSLRDKLDALNAPAAAAAAEPSTPPAPSDGRQQKVERLERWLAKVGRREVTGV